MGDESRVFRAPKGTNEVLPPKSWRWLELTRLAMDTFGRAGYQPIETPIFEHTEVFARGVGEASEVVTKQMYTFEDKGGRSLTLRPEGTAPTIRAILEHGLHRGALPVKVAYAGPFFRQERPQKGRWRQFFQVGIEAVGSDSALVDAEVIEIGARFLADAGVPSRLLLNSIGHPDPSCRDGYIAALRNFLTDNRQSLAEDDRDRVDTNPLRTFDSKEEKTVAVMRDAPVITDHLCDACRKHFDEVQGLLGDLDIAFTLEPRLVRGLDYYTRTAFEYVAEGLGAQNAVGGGGRYDGLSEALGGPPLPAIGFALGLDRIVLASADERTSLPLDCYVVAVGERAAGEALKLTTEFRRAGLGADLDLAQRSLKGQMKDAARSGARWAVILGDEEIEKGEATLKDLETGEQQAVALSDVIGRVKS
ncbi:MAG: histidine--tRNA ligase [Actinomycetota bacterium]